MVFETSRSNISASIYPAALFGSSMLALVALGIYQWLSSRIAAPSAREQIDAERGARDLAG